MLLAALGPTAGGRRPRLLLVEDHADTRLMYAEFLGMEYDVVEASDGLTALEALEQHRPDVIVTDLALPRMDGFELVGRIRTDERFASIPVIALTGYSISPRDERVTRSGITAILQKPCLPEEIIREIETHLQRGADET